MPSPRVPGREASGHLYHHMLPQWGLVSATAHCAHGHRSIPGSAHTRNNPGRRLLWPTYVYSASLSGAPFTKFLEKNFHNVLEKNFHKFLHLNFWKMRFLCRNFFRKFSKNFLHIFTKNFQRIILSIHFCANFCANFYDRKLLYTLYKLFVNFAYFFQFFDFF